MSFLKNVSNDDIKFKYRSLNQTDNKNQKIFYLRIKKKYIYKNSLFNVNN
jgi:hypothetical protein